MDRRRTIDLLWFGPIASVLFFAGTIAVGLLDTGYSHVRQTVSELGEVGVPGRVPFTILLCLVAICLLVSAAGVARSLREAGGSALTAYFMAAMAVSCAGVGVFAFPHPLHNVFGMSETIGLQAPIVAALTRTRRLDDGRLRWFSATMYLVVLLAIAINLIPLLRPAGLWEEIKPIFGLVQRSLFLAWFVWCAGYCLLLMRQTIRR
jgi:hypothetical membrane protein